ncbi:DUF1054 domain-containing protein [Sporolactobacillus sp. STCC-11]|uniref:YktB family protein n=1 Tax=Sporolactobacillus caesalpiniae TaxID=3230362 RepID=UPI0033955A9D
MSQSGFTEHDFELMRLPGLENRMHAIREQIQPKFSRLADHLASFLNERAEVPFYPHIARHARRTVNPPDSTWLALAQDKRGYKKHPHFQFGIWPTHLFFWLAIIEEYPDKKRFGDALLGRLPEIFQSTPSYFSWSADHMKDETMLHHDLDEHQLEQLFLRLTKIKKAELLCGVVISKQEAITKTENDLTSYLEEQVTKLLPLYTLARSCSGLSVTGMNI